MNTSNLSVETDALPIQSDLPEQRFILAKVDLHTFVFPSTIVTQISLIERSQILALSFYNPAILGIIHHQGQIIPLISLRQIVGMSAGLTKESLSVVCLSDAAGDLAGVGLVVDLILGMRSPDQLPPDLFSGDLLPDSTNTDPKMQLFQPEILGSHLWHPQRWQA